MLTLNCWVDCGNLDNNNRMDDVCRRGFLFPANGQGLEFQHGNIVLDESVESFMEADTPESTSGKQNHFYIFSRVAVGRPYIVDDTSASASTPPTRPTGYDSLYVSQKPLDRDQDGFISAEEYEAIAGHDGRDPNSYSHKYVVTDPSQVLPTYVVRFSADVDRDAAEEDKNDPMKVYDRYDFFDPVLYQPVSLRDKMIGSHSMGEAATRKLVNLQDAYGAAVNDSKKVDPLVVAKKQSIMGELNKIDSKVSDSERSERVFTLVCYLILIWTVHEQSQKRCPNAESVTVSKFERLKPLYVGVTAETVIRLFFSFFFILFRAF